MQADNIKQSWLSSPRTPTFLVAGTIPSIALISPPARDTADERMGFMDDKKISMQWTNRFSEEIDTVKGGRLTT